MFKDCWTIKKLCFLPTTWIRFTWCHKYWQPYVNHAFWFIFLTENPIEKRIIWTYLGWMHPEVEMMEPVTLWLLSCFHAVKYFAWQWGTGVPRTVSASFTTTLFFPLFVHRLKLIVLILSPCLVKIRLMHQNVKCIFPPEFLLKSKAEDNKY